MLPLRGMGLGLQLESKILSPGCHQYRLALCRVPRAVCHPSETRYFMVVPRYQYLLMLPQLFSMMLEIQGHVLAEVGAGKAQKLEFWKGGSPGPEGVFVMPRVVATQDHLFVKIHQAVPLTSVHFSVLKSYLHFFLKFIF